MFKCKFAFCSSLEKVFFDMPNATFDNGNSDIFKNEILGRKISIFTENNTVIL